MLPLFSLGSVVLENQINGFGCCFVLLCKGRGDRSEADHCNCSSAPNRRQSGVVKYECEKENANVSKEVVVQNAKGFSAYRRRDAKLAWCHAEGWHQVG
jgi:hypothetical protein